jgi:uncharacterized protein YkwD
VNGRLTTHTLRLVAGAFLSTTILPVHAGPVAGAKICGPYATRAPSTLGSAGGGMVSKAIAAKEVSDLRDALICLINAERTKDGKPALTRNRQLEMAALGHAGEAQRLKWWGSGNPHVNPEKGPQDVGRAISQRISDAGYCPAGATRFSEIAFNWVGAGNAENPGGASPAGAVNWWMNISKSGHREAILDPAVKEIGAGISSQSADKNLQPQALMGTYVVNFGACPTTVSPSPSAGTQREPSVGIVTAPKHGKIPVKP